MKKYNNLSINWLEYITGNKIEPAQWHNQYVPNLDYDFQNYKQPIRFYTTNDRIIVNPENIIAIQYGYEYCGLTWKDFLENLKRPNQYIRRLHSMADILEFINGKYDIYSWGNKEAPKEIIRMCKIDDGFIVLNGQHRACIAKFLNIKIESVYIEKTLDITEKEISQLITMKSI